MGWPPMSLMGQSRPVRASNGSVHARYALKADLEFDGPLPIDGGALHIIQAPKREPRMDAIERSRSASAHTFIAPEI